MVSQLVSWMNYTLELVWAPWDYILSLFKIVLGLVETLQTHAPRSFLYILWKYYKQSYESIRSSRAFRTKKREAVIGDTYKSYAYSKILARLVANYSHRHFVTLILFPFDSKTPLFLAIFLRPFVAYS